MFLRKIQEHMDMNGLFVVLFCLFGVLKKEGDILGAGTLPMVCNLMYYTSAILILFKAITKKDGGKFLQKQYFKAFIPFVVLFVVAEIMGLLMNPEHALKYGTDNVFSSFMTIFNFIASIIAVYCIQVLVGKQSIKFLTIAYVINQVIVFVWAITTYGLSSMVSDLFSIFGLSTTSNSILEVHGATYSLGILILYYLFRSSGKKPIGLLIILFFFFMSGQKRIALIALVVALLLGLFLRKVKLTKGKIIVFSIIFVIGLMVFIWSIYSGTFYTIADKVGISLSGRQFLYRYFTKRTSFSVAQMPWGLDTVNTTLSRVPYTDIHISYIAVALHSDILRNFVEFGFLGFIAWAYLMGHNMLQKIYKCLGEKSAKMYMVCLLYAIIIYAVSNAYYSSPMLILLFSIPLAIDNEEMNSELHDAGVRKKASRRRYLGYHKKS